MRKVIPQKAKMVPNNAKLVFKGQIYSVYQWQQKMYDGTTETFEMLKRPDTLKVIAIKDDEVVILEQEQPDSEEPFFDLPGGRHDIESESELQGAQRELLEETGLIFKDWKLIDVTQPHGKIEQFIYVFIATNFDKQVERKLDSGEKIETMLMSMPELKDLLKNPSARYLPKEIIEKANGIEDLMEINEYKGVKYE